MGISNRPSRITKTVKGTLMGDRLLYSGSIIYSVLTNPEVPKYKEWYFLLQKIGYVYAIVNFIVSPLQFERQ